MELNREWCISKCMQILTQEDSPSSSSSSSEDELEVLQVLNASLVKRTSAKINTSNGPTHVFTMQYAEADFVSHFRIKRSLFFCVCDMFNESLQYNKITVNSKVWSPEKHIAAFLWLAGQKTCSIQDVANRFSISKEGVLVFLRRVLNFLCQKYPNVIEWPNATQQKKTSEHFISNYGIPNVIGCIGSSQLTFNISKEDVTISSENNSQNLLGIQAVCNEEKKFIDIFVSSPGEVQNIKMLNDSSICLKSQLQCGEKYILGNSSYPCKPYLVTPFKEAISDDQVQYNKTLNSCASYVTDAFNALKCRFPGLLKCELTDARTVRQFIIACCVLHNLADLADIDIFQNEENPQSHHDCPASDCGTFDDSTIALKIREKICSDISKYKKISYQIYINCLFDSFSHLVCILVLTYKNS